MPPLGYYFSTSDRIIAPTKHVMAAQIPPKVMELSWTIISPAAAISKNITPNILLKSVLLIFPPGGHF